jgi:hypothetical protein
VRKSEAGRELDGRTCDDMPSGKVHLVPVRAKRMPMIAQVGQLGVGNRVGWMTNRFV